MRRTVSLAALAAALLACSEQKPAAPVAVPAPAREAPAAAPAPEAAPAPVAAPAPAPAPAPAAAPEHKPAPAPAAAPAPAPARARAPAPAAAPAAAAPAEASLPQIEQPGTHARLGAARCKGCHKVQYDSWAASAHAKKGLECESCHGNGGDYVKVMKDKARAAAAGLVTPTLAFCARCHLRPDAVLLPKAHAHKPR